MPNELSNAPTTELGKLVDQAGYLTSWMDLGIGDLERNDKLRWPQLVHSYNSMRSDSQLQGLCAGTTWPLFRMRWYLNPNGARDDAVQRIAQDLNLPIMTDPLPPQVMQNGTVLPAPKPKDPPQQRTQNRFKFIEHLEAALEGVFMGCSIFEQVGTIEDDGLFHYRKLANRPLQTIVEFSIGDDGGLQWVKQHGYDAPNLPIDRLVLYPFQKRGGNWLGRSIMRGCYGPWLLKDRALRVGVMNLQRAGVGTPVIEAHPGATEADLIVLQRLAEKFKAGEKSGGAVPAGAKLRLVGVEGTQPDSVSFIRLLNEEMARAFLQMFMQLGSTQSGSRALGRTFVDWHKLTLEYIAKWFASIFNEHVIEDDIEWNYGPDEKFAPLVEWEWDDMGAMHGSEGQQAANNPSQKLQQQVQDGEIQVGPRTKAALDHAARESSYDDVARHAGRRAARAAGPSATAPFPMPLPGRSLRRQMYEHEITASVDLNELDQFVDSSISLLEQEIRQLQNYQIDQIHDAIVEANGNVKKLAKISVDPIAQDVIAARISQIASLAMEQHLQEIRRQGVSRPVQPDITQLDRTLASRATAIDEVLTERLSGSAAREAIRLTGGAISPTDVAAAVETFVRGKVGAEQHDILSGAAMASVNDGRRLAMNKNNPDRIYASEILDHNTCANCISVDGKSYPDIEAATLDYPAGGYKSCLGRERCRGFYVAVYGGTEAVQ